MFETFYVIFYNKYTFFFVLNNFKKFRIHNFKIPINSLKMNKKKFQKEFDVIKFPMTFK